LVPVNFVAMVNLACVYEKIGKFSAALKWLSMACLAKADYIEAYKGAAFNLFKLGRYAEAKEFIEMAIETV